MATLKDVGDLEGPIPTVDLDSNLIRKRSAVMRNNKEGTRTIEQARNITSEGRLTPYTRMQEETPARIATAAGPRPNFMKTDTQGNQVQKFTDRALTTFSGSHFSVTGLQNLTRADDLQTLKKENIKAKVAYEWKRIYRQLVKMDSDQKGVVDRSQF